MSLNSYYADRVVSASNKNFTIHYTPVTQEHWWTLWEHWNNISLQISHYWPEYSCVAAEDLATHRLAWRPLLLSSKAALTKQVHLGAPLTVRLWQDEAVNEMYMLCHVWLIELTPGHVVVFAKLKQVMTVISGVLSQFWSCFHSDTEVHSSGDHYVVKFRVMWSKMFD